MSNAQTVRSIYAAFGSGDIPAILERLDEDVRWDHWPAGNGAQRAGVPWMAERRGREDVRGFFATLAELEFHDFRPTSVLEGDGMVAAVIEVDVTARATGERFRDLEVHLWTFGPSGRVTEFRHVIDTAKHAAAHAGSPAGSRA